MLELEKYKDTELDNSLSHKIIGAAIEVHRTLGGQDFSKVFMNQRYVVNCLYKG